LTGTRGQTRELYCTTYLFLFKKAKEIARFARISSKYKIQSEKRAFSKYARLSGYRFARPVNVGQLKRYTPLLGGKKYFLPGPPGREKTFGFGPVEF